jgi:hypothetical protein
MNPHEEKDIDMEFQDVKRALKAIYGHSDSECSNNEKLCSMLCSEVLGTSRQGASSRPCAKKLQRWPQHRKQRWTASGWRR